MENDSEMFLLPVQGQKRATNSKILKKKPFQSPQCLQQ
jgi:hypothetical protein